MEKKKRVWNSLEITKIILGAAIAFGVLYIQLSSKSSEDQEHTRRQDSLDRVDRFRQDSLDRKRRIEQQSLDSLGALRSEHLLTLQILHSDSVAKINQAFEFSRMEKQLRQEHGFQASQSEKKELITVCQEALERLHHIACFFMFVQTDCERVDTVEYRKQRSLLSLLETKNEHWFLVLDAIMDYQSFDIYCSTYDSKHSLLSNPHISIVSTNINGSEFNDEAIMDSIHMSWARLNFKLVAELDGIQATP